MSKLRMRKAQLWYFDFIVGATIFLLSIVIALRYVTTDYYIKIRESNILVDEANRLSSSLMTTGIPNNWTRENVVSIGIANEDKSINLSKLEELKEIDNDYLKLKSLIGIKNDFMISFENSEGEAINFGKEYFGIPPNGKDVVTITRYMVYRHDDIAEIIGMKVKVWK